jgi:hypothetical protein
MPNLFTENDPEIVTAWLRARMIGSDEIKAIIGENAFDDLADVKGVKLPFVYWEGSQIGSHSNSGATTANFWQYDVKGVWSSDITGPSRLPCVELSKLLKKVLCDTDQYRAEVPGVGWVWECKFLRWFRPPARIDNNTRVIEHGITIYLLTS